MTVVMARGATEGKIVSFFSPHPPKQLDLSCSVENLASPEDQDVEGQRSQGEFTAL